MLPTSLLLLALAADPAPKPRLDADGVPLPAEAVQRLGSATFLVNRFAGAAFSPDGKTVYTVSDEDSSDWRQPYTSPGLVAWEVPSGKKLWQAGVDRRLEQVMADPDGKSVWVLERVKRTIDEDPDQFQRVRYATSDGKELARTPLVESRITPVLHPTGLMTDVAGVFDREGKSTELVSFQHEKDGYVGAVFWSAAGDRVYLGMVGGELNAPHLIAIDISKHERLWSTATDSIGGWCVAPDGKSVVIVTQKGEVMHARRLDTKTGKELGAVELKGVTGVEVAETLNDRGEIYFHPDGKTLFVIDKERRTLAIDVATWKTVATKVKLAAHAVFSPDGKLTLAPSGRHVVLHETDTGNRLSPHDGGMSCPDHNTRLLFSPNSDRVTRNGWFYMPELEWDATTGREVSRRVEKDTPRTDGEYCETFSADGKAKAVLTKKDDEWRFTVTHPDKPKDPPVVLKAGWGEVELPYRWASFTPDARHLVAADPKFGLHIWDTKTGERRGEVKIHGGESLGVCSDGMQISPNGRWAAVPERGSPVAQIVPPSDLWSWRIGVYEIPSAKLVQHFEGNGELETYRWVDDRLAALVNFPTVGTPFGGLIKPSVQKSQLVSIDPSAKAMKAHPIDVGVRAWAAAPFGDTVAVGSSDGLRLYEASTGKLRHTFRDQKRPVEVLAFSPNGRQLAAESVDGPILLWDVRGDLSKPAKPDAAGWDRAWAALGEVDAAAAFQAVRLFALYPDEGAAELKRRFADKPATAEEIAAIVAKLDDRTFAVRQKAEGQLRAMGAAAFPALQKAMRGEPSEEFKERAGRLLAVQIPADRQRAERAVEALRLADTDAAKKLLAEWANGDAKSPLTVAAKRR